MKITVAELVKKFDLANVRKNYETIYGDRCNLVNLEKLAKTDVLSINYNIYSNECIITLDVIDGKTLE